MGHYHDVACLIFNMQMPILYSAHLMILWFVGVDNAGPTLSSDLCLLDIVVCINLTTIKVIHGRDISWYV